MEISSNTWYRMNLMLWEYLLHRKWWVVGGFLSSLHVYGSFQGFCSLRLLLHLWLKTHPHPPLFSSCKLFNIPVVGWWAWSILTSQLLCIAFVDLYWQGNFSCHWINRNYHEKMRLSAKKRLTGQGCCFWLQGAPCMVGVMQDVYFQQYEWSKWVRPYLQSIFSTKYAHIRKPVRLKPCVQWTPLGERKEEAQEVQNSESHYKFTFIWRH